MRGRHQVDRDDECLPEDLPRARRAKSRKPKRQNCFQRRCTRESRAPRPLFRVPRKALDNVPLGVELVRTQLRPFHIPLNLWRGGSSVRPATCTAAARAGSPCVRSFETSTVRARSRMPPSRPQAPATVPSSKSRPEESCGHHRDRNHGHLGGGWDPRAIRVTARALRLPASSRRPDQASGR